MDDIAISKGYMYILMPSNLELRAITRGPIHKTKNIMVNASWELPLVLMAASPAEIREMKSGPNKSHSRFNR